MQLGYLKQLSKSSLILLCLSTWVYGVDLQAQKQQISASDKVIYTQALEAFKAKRFEQSYELFNDLFGRNLDNVFINYYLGRSAYELGQFDLASSAYERILISEPSMIRVRLELAQTYFRMKLWAQALEEFILVSKGNLPAQVRQRVEKSITILNEKEKKGLFSFQLSLGVVYDSNINNVDSLESFNIYSPDLNASLTLQNPEEISTMMVQTIGSLNHKYKLDDNRIIDNNLNLIFLKYNNHKEKDIQLISYTLSPTLYTKRSKMSIVFGFDKLYLAHNPFQTGYYIKPEFTAMLFETIVSTSSIKLERTNFSNDSSKDGKIIEFANSFKYANEVFGLFSLGLSGGKEIDINHLRSDISYEFGSIALSHTYEIADDYTLNTSGTYKYTLYDKEDLNFQSRREDRKYDASIGVSHAWKKDVNVGLSTSYTKRDSNHASSDYDKYTIKLNVTAAF